MSNRDAAFEGRYLSDEDEEFLRRCERRLREQLGVEAEDVEIILHLRQQVVTLQERIRNLESELENRQRYRQIRLARYQRVYIEGIWYERDEE